MACSFRQYQLFSFLSRGDLNAVKTPLFIIFPVPDFYLIIELTISYG